MTKVFPNLCIELNVRHKLIAIRVTQPIRVIEFIGHRVTYDNRLVAQSFDCPIEVWSGR